MAALRKELCENELLDVVGGNVNINTVYNQVKNTTTGIKYNINLDALQAEEMSYQDLADWITNNRTSLGGDNGTIDELLRLGWIAEIPAV